MDPKSSVLKSKSSNSAISKKSKDDVGKPYNKKSRSNADFPHHSLKKRGMYVEKRSTKINLRNNVEEVTQKPPQRPRPGQKKFLASVLNILSKCTTGTQFPEANDHSEVSKYHDRVRTKPRLQNNSKEEDIEFKNVNDTRNSKDKFKSRVLSKKYVKEDRKKTVVLQYKKEISQTPSNLTGCSYKNDSQNSKESNLMIYDASIDTGGINIAEELKKAVLEGRNVEVKKLRYFEDEPETLVSDKPKEQKNLYNFFVDLLETTISVYNVKTEYDAADPDDESKINLQINESVIKKLDIDKSKKRIVFEDGDDTSQYAYDVQDEMNDESDFINMKTKPITSKSIKREVPIKAANPRKLNTNSFNLNTNKKIAQKSKSVEIRRKPMFKNKTELINVLKQELELQTNTYEEPRSIFQALRVMARNKKKITFDPSLDHKTLTDECYLKRRKVISSRKFKKVNRDAGKKNILTSFKPMISGVANKENHTNPYTDKARKDIIEIGDRDSYQSLEVYGFDYEPNSVNLPFYTKSKDVTRFYHSSPSESDLDLDFHDAVLNPTVT